MSDLRLMVAGFSCGVLVTFLILGWKTLRPMNRIVILSFASLQAISVVTRMFFYEAGEAPAPGWYLTVMDINLIIISVALTVSIWLSIGRKHRAVK